MAFKMRNPFKKEIRMEGKRFKKDEEAKFRTDDLMEDFAGGGASGSKQKIGPRTESGKFGQTIHTPGQYPFFRSPNYKEVESGLKNYKKGYYGAGKSKK